MSSITNFLKIKPTQKKTKKVKCELGGVEVEFVLSSLPIDKLNDIQLQNNVTIPASFAGGPTSVGVDPLGLAIDMLMESIIEPDLDNIQIQDHFKASNKQELLVRMFDGNNDALAELGKVVNELSGADKNKGENKQVTEDLVEEAKN